LSDLKTAGMPPAEALVATNELRKTISDLEATVKQYTDIYGPITSDSNSDLKELLKRRSAELETLAAKCDFFQKTESTLLSEIETIGSAWAQLETQTARKVLDLTEKEELVLRLSTEV
jgi:E3 ubiquitin-protein ligase BRE1